MDARTGAGLSGEEDLYAQHFACFPRDIIHFIQQFQQLRLQLFGGGSAAQLAFEGLAQFFQPWHSAIAAAAVELMNLIQQPLRLFANQLFFHFITHFWHKGDQHLQHLPRQIRFHGGLA